MKTRKKIDIIRVDVDIVKTKLMFFVGLVGSDVYLLANYDKISQFFEQYLILIIFNILGGYAIIGVIFNLIDLNQLKINLKELL